MFDILRSNAVWQVPIQRGIPHLAGQALTTRTVQNQLKERLNGHQCM